MNIFSRKRPGNLVVIFAHKGTTMGTEILGSENNQITQAIFDRHLPYWEHHGWPIVVICPRSGVIQTKHEVVTCGDNEHSGLSGYRRIQTLLHILGERKYEYAIIHEYDSICLEPKPVLRLGFWGNVWPNYEPSRFMSYRYSNPPWTLDRMSAKAMLRTMEKYPSIEEEGFHDRLLAALADTAGVPSFGFHLKGMTNDTLLERDRHELTRRIVDNSAYWIHGIKTEGALKAVLQLWENRKKDI